MAKNAEYIIPVTARQSGPITSINITKRHDKQPALKNPMRNLQKANCEYFNDIAVKKVALKYSTDEYKQTFLLPILSAKGPRNQEPNSIPKKYSDCDKATLQN